MKSSSNIEKKGPGRKGKSQNPVIQGGRRITRLQSKLNTLPLQSSAPLIQCSKLKDAPHLDQDKHDFLSAERLKEAGIVSTMKDYNEHEISEVHSSCSPHSSQFQALIDNFCEPVPTSITPQVQTNCLIPQNDELLLSAKRPKEAPNPSKPVAETLPVENDKDGLEPFPSRPVTCREVNFEQRAPVEHSNHSAHFGLTEIVSVCGDEDLNADEAESSSVHLILGLYTVKEALEPTIRSVIEKHGDIVANCHMKTPRGRTGVLESFAEFIEYFGAKTFAVLSESEIDAAIQVVSDFSEVGLDVGWLQRRLKDLLEARQMVKQYSGWKEKQKKKDDAVEEKRRALEIAESRRVLLQQQVNAAEEQVNAAKRELEAEVAETESLKATMSKAVSNVKYFNAHPPLHGLL